MAKKRRKQEERLRRLEERRSSAAAGGGVGGAGSRKETLSDVCSVSATSDCCESATNELDVELMARTGNDDDHDGSTLDDLGEIERLEEAASGEAAFLEGDCFQRASPDDDFGVTRVVEQDLLGVMDDTEHDDSVTYDPVTIERGSFERVSLHDDFEVTGTEEDEDLLDDLSETEKEVKDDAVLEDLRSPEFHERANLGDFRAADAFGGAGTDSVSKTEAAEEDKDLLDDLSKTEEDSAPIEDLGASVPFPGAPLGNLRTTESESQDGAASERAALDHFGVTGAFEEEEDMLDDLGEAEASGNEHEDLNAKRQNRRFLKDLRKLTEDFCGSPLGDLKVTTAIKHDADMLYNLGETDRDIPEDVRAMKTKQLNLDASESHKRAMPEELIARGPFSVVPLDDLGLTEPADRDVDTPTAATGYSSFSIWNILRATSRSKRSLHPGAGPCRPAYDEQRLRCNANARQLQLMQAVITQPLGFQVERLATPPCVAGSASI